MSWVKLIFGFVTPPFFRNYRPAGIFYNFIKILFDFGGWEFIKRDNWNIYNITGLKPSCQHHHR